MVHYYCFCENIDTLGVGSRVFKVRVGESQRDLIKKFFVDSYAVRNGCFFRLWDSDTEAVLRSAQGSGVKPCGLSPFLFDVIQVSICDLSYAIMQGDLNSLRNSDSYFSALFRDSSVLSPTFRAMYLRLPSISSALTSMSKNLSPRERREVTNAVVCSCLVFALFLLGSCLEGMEHLFY